MTKEEAIKVLNIHKTEPFCSVCSFSLEECNDCENCIIIEALDVAIKTLEQEKQTGHWKHNKCDVCGASRPPLFDNFCPNCGVKIEREKI